MDNDELHFVVETDPNFAGQRREREPLHICWDSGAGFGVCIESWSDDSLTVGIYVAGVKFATVTLSIGDPCYECNIDETGLKVRVKVCANFTDRNVSASGEVCVLGLCARFNQIIFSF